MKSRLIDEFGLRSFRGALGADDPGRITELEKAAGRKLPDDYREFLLTLAPGFFSEEVKYRPVTPSPWTPKDGLNSLDAFFGLEKKDSSFDLIAKYERIKGDIPDGMIPIAYDAGANRILMALDAPPGRVYFQDKDTGDVYLCARTFTDFINSFEYAPYGRLPAEQ